MKKLNLDAIKHVIVCLALFAGFQITSLQADVPDRSIDATTLEAEFSDASIVSSLSYALNNCYQRFCWENGNFGTFLNLDRLGVSPDGQAATLWIGHFIPETLDFWAPLWSEVVYLETWHGQPPYTDYPGASAAIHGINFWAFVEEVLDAALNNRNYKGSLEAPGWYGVHLSDFSVLTQTAAPADIALTAKVRRVPGGSEANVTLTFSATLR